jgi:TldD protein
MRELLKAALAGDGGEDHVELRYHKKVFRSLTVQSGKLERSTTRRREGVGVRVLSLGNWGFAATDDLTITGVRRAIEAARTSARATAPMRKEAVTLAPCQLAVGSYSEPGVEEVVARSLDARVALVMAAENHARSASTRIQSASSTYNEIVTHKAIVTSDGADVSFR